MYKKQKKIKKTFIKKEKNKKTNIESNKIKKIEQLKASTKIIPFIKESDIKKTIIVESKNKNLFKKGFKYIWFSLGILDLIWTIFWLIYSFNQKSLYNLTSLVFFAIGFYIFCIFILITLIYYIIKMTIKIKKQNV